MYAKIVCIATGVIAYVQNHNNYTLIERYDKAQKRSENYLKVEAVQLLNQF